MTLHIKPSACPTSLQKVDQVVRRERAVVRLRFSARTVRNRDPSMTKP